jgi:hypothetical protein
VHTVTAWHRGRQLSVRFRPIADSGFGTLFRGQRIWRWDAGDNAQRYIRGFSLFWSCRHCAIPPFATCAKGSGTRSIHSAPTGRTTLLGGHSPDCATLHPGLFSFPPSGRKGSELRFIVSHISESRCVGSRTGAMLRRSGLSVAPRFLWECLNSPTVNWFPIPAASNGACGFPALRSPVAFASRVMWPM